MENLIPKAAVLIEALPYIQRFRDALVVIKYGGSAMDNLDQVESTIRDIVFMECVGMKPLIVHGGGKEITEAMQKMGSTAQFVNGHRVTSRETIDVVDDVLHNVVNPKLVNAIIKFGGKAAPLCGKDLIVAEKMYQSDPKTGEQLDIGFVGNVVSVNTDPIHAILAQECVPVISPMGQDKEGNRYNINSDLAACAVAEHLRARKLVFLSDVPGILADPANEDSLISTIRVDQIDQLIADKVISSGMVPKIQSAVKALHAGASKVHLIDGRIQHSLLLEIFTDRGVGTEIVMG